MPKKPYRFGPTKPSAQGVLDDFFARVEQHTADVGTLALNILVWGANPLKPIPLAQKRVEIRDELRRIGHGAAFSEEIVDEMKARGVALPSSLKVTELAQAHTADYIVVLMGPEAPGSSGEMHDFVVHPDIAPKLCVMCPASYKNGYSGNLIEQMDNTFHNVKWYEPHELTDCDVLTYALEQVSARKEYLLMCQST